MKLKMMKRSITVLAAALTAVSTSALAENTSPKTFEPTVSQSVQLNDAELDGITAGTVSIALILITPSNRSAFYMNEEQTRLVCINCGLPYIDPELFPKGRSAYGILSIEKTGREQFLLPIGKWPVPRF
jgi:hypothetical protein